MAETLNIEPIECDACGGLLPGVRLWPANPRPCACKITMGEYPRPVAVDPQAELIKRIDRIIQLLEGRSAS